MSVLLSFSVVRSYGTIFETAAVTLKRHGKNQWNQGTRRIIDNTQKFNQIKDQWNLTNSLI
ncbi:MAG: hypothetical protein WCF23_11890 [Candidatus Nitrosopolaris sp.]